MLWVPSEGLRNSTCNSVRLAVSAQLRWPRASGMCPSMLDPATEQEMELPGFGSWNDRMDWVGRNI